MDPLHSKKDWDAVPLIHMPHIIAYRMTVLLSCPLANTPAPHLPTQPALP